MRYREHNTYTYNNPPITSCPITLTSITHLRDLREKQSKASLLPRYSALAPLIYFKITGIPRIKAGRYTLATLLHLPPLSHPIHQSFPFFLGGSVLISHLIGSDLINFTENAIKRPQVAPSPPHPSTMPPLVQEPTPSTTLPI